MILVLNNPLPLNKHQRPNALKEKTGNLQRKSNNHHRRNGLIDQNCGGVRSKLINEFVAGLSN